MTLLNLGCGLGAFAISISACTYTPTSTEPLTTRCARNADAAADASYDPQSRVDAPYHYAVWDMTHRFCQAEGHWVSTSDYSGCARAADSAASRYGRDDYRYIRTWDTAFKRCVVNLP